MLLLSLTMKPLVTMKAGLLLLFILFILLSTALALPLFPRIKADNANIKFTQPVSAWLHNHPEIKVGIIDESTAPDISGATTQGQVLVDTAYLQNLAADLNVKFQLQHYENKAHALAALDRGDITLLTVQNPLRCSPLSARLGDNVSGCGQNISVQQKVSGFSLHALPDAALASGIALPLPVYPQRSSRLWLLSDAKSAVPQVDFAVRHDAPELLEALSDRLRYLPTTPRYRIALSPTEERPLTSGYTAFDITEPLLEWLQNRPPMTVIVDARRAPFTFDNARGRPDGLAVAILQLFTRRYGLQFDYKIAYNEGDISRLIARYPAAILASEITLSDSNSQYPQRLLSDPWMVTPAVLVMNTQTPQPGSLHDLNGEHIAISRESPLRSWIEIRYPLLQLELSNSDAQAIKWLEEGKVRGVITTQFAAEYYRARSNSEHLSSVLTLPVTAMHAGFSVAGNDPLTLAILNMALQHTPQDTLFGLAQNWHNPLLHTSEAADRLPSLRLMLLLLSFVFAAVLLVALWMSFLRQPVRRLFENLRSRKVLIEQLQTAREENVKIVESRGVFMKSIGHEVRTPLNSLVGLLEVELARHQDSGHHNENLQAAYESACSLMMVTGNALNLFQHEDSSTHTIERIVDLHSLVNSTVALYRHQAREKGLDIDTRLALMQPLVECEPLLIIRILSSLLRNAIKHTSQGTIAVGLSQHIDSADGHLSLTLEVRDQGAGLAQQRVAPEVAEENDLNAVWAETGLSLEDCQRLAEHAGASLNISSTPGCGTCVSLYFTASPVSHGVGPLPEPSQQSGVILIVDDYPPACMLLKQQLNKLGYRILTACNGRDGFAVWQQYYQRLSAVITDCTMPEMDGFALSRAIRQKEKENNFLPTQIIGLTALSRHEAETACLNAGMDMCFTKPLSIEQLKPLLTPPPRSSVQRVV